MEFRPEDISRLYGKRFFSLPDLPQEEKLVSESTIATETSEEIQGEVEHLPKPEGFLIGGVSIDWKMKPDARLALVMDAGAFANKSLTTHLKQSVLEAGINVKEIGFGVFPQEAEKWGFETMPTSCGIILGACKGQLTASLLLNGKHMVPAPSLAQAAASPEVHSTLITSLKEAWALASKA